MRLRQREQVKRGDRKEDKALRAEKKGLEEPVGSEKKKWTDRGSSRRVWKEKFGKKTRSQAPQQLRRSAPRTRGRAASRKPGGARADHGRALRQGRGWRAIEDMSRTFQQSLQADDKLKLSFFAETHSSSDVRPQWALLHGRGLQAARAGAGMASRCGVHQISGAGKRTSSRCSVQGAANSDRKTSKAKASRSRGRGPRYERARASRLMQRECARRGARRSASSNAVPLRLR